MSIENKRSLQFSLSGMVLYGKFSNAPIAQLDRASDYESAGCRFESCWARHPYFISISNEIIPVVPSRASFYVVIPLKAWIKLFIELDHSLWLIIGLLFMSVIIRLDPRIKYAEMS